ncbi:MAG: carboxypeptidase-like regulatory domain-containing protein [Terriglobales bacterium]
MPIRCLIFLLIACPLFGQGSMGKIIGTVVDERGTPVPHAQVSPDIRGVFVMSSLVVIVETDANGRFEINGLAWGSYDLYASKEADGYPNTRFSICRTRPAPKVTLSPGHPTGQATLVIGPQGGVLVVSVRDAVSGAPVNSQLVLKRADGLGEIMISEPADFHALLPTNTDLSIEIRQQGYKPWSYATRPNSFLRVRSGEQVKIEVEIVPARVETR